MTRLQYGHIIADGLRIQYYRTGGEKPPVILVHGLAEYGLGWGRFPVFIEPSYDVTALDLRGHGMSDKPEKGYTAFDMSADIFWTIKMLNLVRPVVIGHSLGASVVAQFALQNPKLVSGIILIDPPWRSETVSIEERPVAARSYVQWLTELKQKSLAMQIAVCKTLNPNWQEGEYMQWAKGKQLVSEFTAEWYTHEHPSCEDVAAHLRVPGLLLYGDRQAGGIVSPQVAERVSAIWKKGKIHHLPGAGHFIHRDQYFKFRDVVRYFLRSAF